MKSPVGFPIDDQAGVHKEDKDKCLHIEESIGIPLSGAC